MSITSRTRRYSWTRKFAGFELRSLARTALLVGFGFAGNLASTGILLAQNVNNSSTLNLQTNAVLHASNGGYNNLSAGVLNFNGPSGAAQWSASNLTINNAGQVNLVRGDLGIIGDLTNTGQFHIAPLGGIVQVDGHFTNSGTKQVPWTDRWKKEIVKSP